MRDVDVLVIGAGQAGLSVGYHLRRRGFRRPEEAASGHTYLMLDHEDAPGGAWRHRWESLTMASVNRIFDLPGMPQEEVDPATPSRVAVPDYFASFESQMGLGVERPVEVTQVRFETPDDPLGRLVAETPAGEIRARVLVNSTGTWRRPFVPYVPGFASFAGRHVRTVDYVAASDFAGQRVGIVGGGISAVGFLAEVSYVAQTFWYTRREPVFLPHEFKQDQLTLAVEQVDARVREGLPPKSVVAVTGLRWTPTLLDARDRGAMERRPMFTRIDPTGVIEASGEHTDLDAIIWATGFRADLGHLAPLHLHGPRGGIVMDPPMVAGEPRIYLVGYGPSASTVGANRAGRVAVNRLQRYLDADRPA